MTCDVSIHHPPEARSALMKIATPPLFDLVNGRTSHFSRGYHGDEGEDWGVQLTRIHQSRRDDIMRNLEYVSSTAAAKNILSGIFQRYHCHRVYSRNQNQERQICQGFEASLITMLYYHDDVHREKGYMNNVLLEIP